MKKVYIIVTDDSTTLSALMANIPSLGNYYALYNNQCLLFCDINSSKEVYDKFASWGYDGKRMVVFELSKSDDAYWGFSDKSLWEWLKIVYSDLN